MAGKTSINLLKTKEAHSPMYDAWAPKLSMVSVFLVVAVLVSGSIVGGLFLFLSRQQSRLLSDKARLVDELSRYTEETQTLTRLKQRIGIVEKAIGFQPEWEQVMEIIKTIGSVDAIIEMKSSESVKRVTGVYSVGTIEEAVSIVSAFAQTAARQDLGEPQLDLLTLDQAGVKVAVSFIRPF